MNKQVHYFLCFIFCFISTSVFAQQPKEEWTKRYSGMGSQRDSPSSMAVDAAGNIYVAGTTQHTEYAEIGLSIVIVKYAPNGEKLWEKVYEANNTAAARAIAVDNTGGIYVTGAIGYWSPNPDYLTVRFDAETGEVDWDETYNGATNGQDEPTGIAVDNMGGVYVTGSSATTPFGNIGDFVTIRYDALTGERSWVSSYDGYNGGQDIPAAIAVDKSGGVFVTGFSQGGGVLPDNVTIAYNAADGTERWRQRGGSATDIAVDNLGGVYVTGTKWGQGDFLTIRYDAASGTQSSWDMTFNGDYNGYDEAVAITTDNQGGIYVTGHSETAGISLDFITIRYDAATQTRTWIATYDGGYDRASGIVTDNQGRVFITGYSFKDGHYDFVIIGYMAASGNKIWDKRYDGPAHGYDLGLHIAADGLGGVYVSGRSEGLGTQSDITTIRYEASDGFESWVERIDIKGHLEDMAIAVTTDAKGNSYVTGTSNYTDFMEEFSHIVTVKYAPSGDTLWVRSFKAEQNQRASSTAIAVDAEGNTYITGNIYRSYFVETTTQMVTIKYSPSGEELWAKKHEMDPNSRAASIAVDNTGGVYVTGTSYQIVLDDYGYYDISSSKYITIRYDESTGEERWVSPHAATGYHLNSASALALDNSGRVYVTGTSRNNTSFAISTVRYDATTGNEDWRAEPFIRTGVNTSIARAIAVDNKGGVYVTGYSYSVNDPNYTYDYTTVGYDAASGKLRWDKHYNGSDNSNDQAIAIAVDNTGGVFVTGYSYRNSNLSSSDFATIRYDAITGHQDWLKRYDGPSGNRDDARAIAVDNQGGVYVTGGSYGEDYRNSTFSTVKYATSDGEKLWDIQSSGSRDAAMDLALDAEGNVFVTGYSYFSETSFDLLTIKYSQQSNCPPLAAATISGKPEAKVGTSGSVYSLAPSGGTSFNWVITDGNGTTHTNFTGQGTSLINVKWPSSPQVYKITVSYNAGENCTSQAAVMYVHVFAPKAGFVTGGGWSTSPAHTAYELMQQQSKAHWSFSAKYKKQNVVEGSLLLKAEGFTFRSTHIDDGSLVIAGDKAYFRGQGTLTKKGNSGTEASDSRQFGFLLAATDAQALIQGKGHGKKNSIPDQLRILIWEINSDNTHGPVVYDNQIACSSGNVDYNAPACDAIEQGSIVIHRQGMKIARSDHALIAGETPEAQGMMVYPTHFSNRATVNFKLANGGEYLLELYDMRGVMVKRISAGSVAAGQLQEYEISAAGLAKGLYLLRLTSANELETVKLVVQR